MTSFINKMMIIVSLTMIIAFATQYFMMLKNSSIWTMVMVIPSAILVIEASIAYLYPKYEQAIKNKFLKEVKEEPKLNNEELE